MGGVSNSAWLDGNIEEVSDKEWVLFSEIMVEKLESIKMENIGNSDFFLKQVKCSHNWLDEPMVLYYLTDLETCTVHYSFV